MKDKDFTYINDYYGKKFKANKIVRASGELGVLLYGDNYAWVKMENGEIRNYHPSDVNVLEDEDE